MTQAQQEDVSQFLQPFVDGELSDDERMRVIESLESSESSDAARAYVRTQTEVRELLRSLPRTPAPARLREQIRGALDEAEEAQQGNVVQISRWRQRVASVSITLLPAAAAAALLFMYVRGEPSTSGDLGASAQQLVAAPAPQKTDPASLPLVRGTVRPAKLHLPQGVQLVSSNPLPLGTDTPGESLELVDSSDGQRFLLRIRPGDTRPNSGNEVVVLGRTYWRVPSPGGGQVVEFFHGGRIVTISTLGKPSAATSNPSADTDATFRRLLAIAQSLEIR
jgi:hypothetical protein